MCDTRDTQRGVLQEIARRRTLHFATSTRDLRSHLHMTLETLYAKKPFQDRGKPDFPEQQHQRRKAGSFEKDERSCGA